MVCSWKTSQHSPNSWKKKKKDWYNGKHSLTTHKYRCMLFTKKGFGSVGRGQGLSIAGKTPSRIQLSPIMKVLHHFKKQEKHWVGIGREEWRRCEKNQVTIRVREEGGRVGSPGTRAEIPLQSTDKITVEQVLTYSLWEGPYAGGTLWCPEEIFWGKVLVWYFVFVSHYPNQF